MIFLTRTPVWSISSVKLNGIDVPLSDISIDNDKMGMIFRKHPFENTTFVMLWLRPFPLSYGARLWEITYDAGYDPPEGTVQDHPMPRDIQRATLEIARAIWTNRSTNPAVRTIKVGEASETREPASETGYLTAYAERLLQPWVRLS